jgi:23S rRNA C2498 (ribose-2'-O)-methylase RlmM
LDIGAAPGGWTVVLASHGAHVCSVDPAILTLPASQANNPNIVHFKCKAQECVEQVRARFDDGTYILDGLVCDANMPPTAAWNMVKCYEGFVRKGGMVVLTCKITKRNQTKTLTEEAKVLMQNWCEDIQVLHLLSNTLNERTIVGRIK